MATIELQITVDFDKAANNGYAPESVNIAELLSGVSHIHIVKGDPNVSMHVWLPEEREKALRDAVEDRCIVEPFTFLNIGGPFDWF